MQASRAMPQRRSTQAKVASPESDYSCTSDGDSEDDSNDESYGEPAKKKRNVAAVSQSEVRSRRSSQSSNGRAPKSSTGPSEPRKARAITGAAAASDTEVSAESSQMVELQLQIDRKSCKQSLGANVEAVKTANERVVLVTEVAPNGCSALGGLKVGDVLRSADGRALVPNPGLNPIIKILQKLPACFKLLVERNYTNREASSVTGGTNRIANSSTNSSTHCNDADSNANSSSDTGSSSATSSGSSNRESAAAKIPAKSLELSRLQEQFMCGICDEIMVDAWSFGCSGGHANCKACVLPWVKEHATCPQCQSKVSLPGNRNVPVDQIIEAAVIADLVDSEETIGYWTRRGIPAPARASTSSRPPSEAPASPKPARTDSFEPHSSLPAPTSQPAVAPTFKSNSSGSGGSSSGGTASTVIDIAHDSGTNDAEVIVLC